MRVSMGAVQEDGPYAGLPKRAVTRLRQRGIRDKEEARKAIASYARQYDGEWWKAFRQIGWRTAREIEVWLHATTPPTFGYLPHDEC